MWGRFRWRSGAALIRPPRSDLSHAPSHLVPVVQSPYTDLLSLSATIFPLYHLLKVCYLFLSDVSVLTQRQQTSEDPLWLADNDQPN